MNIHTCGELHAKYEAAANDTVNRLSNGETFKSICADYGFEKNAFARYLDKKGYRKKKVIDKNRKHIEATKLANAYNMLQNGKSLSYVSKVLHVTVGLLRRELRDIYNWKALDDGKKAVDDFYFHDINTAEKAYWLGFFAADGYNNSNTHTIEFCLQDQDKYAVENFAKAIKSQYKISKKIVAFKYVSWRISIKSLQMSQDLESLGFGCQKTYNKTWPELKEEMYPHLVRGLVDGDGCIPTTATGRIGTMEISAGSEQFVQQAVSFLLDHGFCCYWQKDKRTKSGYRIIFYRDSTRKLLDWCYRDSTETTRLKRKYEKYLNEKQHCRP